ncbi:MAG: histidine kinase [Phaeodactylibacter sp.]|nr:histidine kinase [Phaeodactylibacter sp.]MCB9277122.1 histidine kinase [Lewinellaceae bacterium]
MHSLKRTEALLITLVWVVLAAAPYLFGGESRFASWRQFARPMEVLLPLLAIFLANRLLFVPRLLFRERRVGYILAVGATILLLTVGLYFYRQQGGGPPPPGLHPVPRPLPPYVNLLITAILLVGFDTGLKAALRVLQSEREKEELEKDHVKSQLALLHQQVSPHFFMNTLNNIHALVEISPEQAREAILQLSKMMRYLLYDTAQGRTTLRKEAEFMRSYIGLMKLRVPEKVELALNLPGDIPDVELPPALFVPFIENAFKHGIGQQERPFIRIGLWLEKGQLFFQAANSKDRAAGAGSASGIGIENVRKRLGLLYGADFHLEIKDGQDIFTVKLTIPI